MRKNAWGESPICTGKAKGRRRSKVTASSFLKDGRGEFPWSSQWQSWDQERNVEQLCCLVLVGDLRVDLNGRVTQPREPTGKPLGKNQCLSLHLVRANSPETGRIALLYLCTTKGIFRDSRQMVGFCGLQNKAQQSPQLGP